MAGATTGKRLTSPTPADNGKHPGGRPRIVFDLDLVERLGGLNATKAEMGTLLGCSHDVIDRQMRDKESEFSVAYQKGRAKLGTSLKRKLVQQALEKDNVVSLIFALKNVCGFSDKAEVNVEHSGHLITDEKTLMGTWREMLGAPNVENN
jgi:hypothetical protein|tara:strand:+ start:13736 stop:14185 length:450 start_codon:yes stop_codon:yes gene_type:complete